MISLFKKSPTTLAIIFDIGGSSVRAGLVRFEHGKNPNIIFTAREAIPFQQIVNPPRLFSLMLETLRIISLKMAKEGLAHLKFTKHGALSVDYVFYVFSSPWSASESKKVTVHKDKPFDITESYLKGIVDQQEVLFEKEYSTSSDDNLRKTLIVVDKQIIQVKLNGYETANPYNKHASRVDISSFISLVPKEVLDNVEEVGIRGIGSRNRKAFSLSLIALSTIRDLFKDETDFIFLDVTSTLTDVTIVKDGVMLENVSFPLGKDFLINKLAKVLSLPYDVTRSTYRAYLDNQVDDATKNLIKPVVERARGEWFVLFQDALQSVSLKSAVPRTIFLIVSNTFRDFFSHAIQDQKFNQFNIEGAAFRLEVLDYEQFKDKVTYGKSIYKDPFISLESIFVDKFLSS